MFNRDQMVAEIAKEVVSRLQQHMHAGSASFTTAANGATTPAAAPAPAAGKDGIFETVDEAVNASIEAQKKVAALSLEQRGKIIHHS